MTKPTREPISTADEHWRLERRVPVMMVVTLGLHFAALVAWGAYLEARVSVLEHDRGNTLLIIERLARLEERVNALHNDVTFLRRKAEK